MVTDVIAGRYAIGEKIGSGGMGDVFRGIDQRTETPIAIKMLKSDLASDEMVARFVREGEALRQLNHPHIVTLLDAVQENGQYYLVMELVTGGALDDLLHRTSRLPLPHILNIALDLADALTRAHRLQIIHRDIKPANVLLTADSIPRLTDFGIARVHNSSITEQGNVMGTLAYIAPEILMGDAADVRSDIWSFGIMLFEMLAGEHPFKSANPGSLVYTILSEPLPDIERLRPDAPPALIDLVQRMVIKNPAERIPRMRLVGAELEAILSGDIPTLPADDATSVVAQSGVAHTRFATPSPISSRIIHHNLPAQMTPFVGRETEINELEMLLHDPLLRLVTIVAPGGMGKTRLSLEIATRFLNALHQELLFENGIYVVDLTPLTSAENIVPVVAEAVGYAFQHDGRSAQQQLLDYLQHKKVLLIFDNFEHVIAGRTLIQDILQAVPTVKILATSREKLNLSAETVFILGGMAFPEWETPEDALDYAAVRLFMQSARRVRPDFQLMPSDLAFVARICHMVQGTPLGIVLAAAWLEMLSVSEIVVEISKSLDFLETEMHDLPERQRSLRAVFEYSWALLTEQERMLFAQCSIFRGGFTREAAQHITGVTLRALTTMVNKSLLRRDVVSGRYEVHELLRQYAEEKLGEQATPIREAHYHYYLDLPARLTLQLKGHGQLDALNAIETDFENIRAAWHEAIQHRNAEVIQQAIEGLYLFLQLRNRFMDGEQLFRAARQVWRADTEPTLLAGQVLVRYPELPPLAHFRNGLAIAQQHDNLAEIAFCERLVGHWLSQLSHDYNQGEGIPMLQQSLDHYQQIGNKFCVAQVLDDLGWSYRLIGDDIQQRVVIEQSLALRREIGDKFGTANSLRNLGGGSGGFFDMTGESFDYWQEAKILTYELRDRMGIAWNASLQAANLLFRGEFEGVPALLDESYPHAAEMNDVIVLGFIQTQRAILAAVQDEDYPRAKQHLLLGFPPGTLFDFRSLLMPAAVMLIACGEADFDFLKQYINPSVELPAVNQQTFFIPLVLPCCVLAKLLQNDDVSAAQLLSAMHHSEYTFTGRVLSMVWLQKWQWLQRTQAQLQTRLGQEAFAAAWEQGKSISIENQAQEIDHLRRTLL